MNKKYRCSLFCSFYRAEKFIEGYLKNVYEQSIFEDIEFIFLDCASPCKEGENFLSSITESNIKYKRLEKDPGLYAAWNIAVRMCSAPVIGNWNVDDRKNKEGLEILLNQFDKYEDLDIVYGPTYISRKANEEYKNNNFEEVYPCLEHSLNNLFKNNSPHCMPLWKKNLHDRFGYFDENYKTASDGDFWLRCAIGGATIKKINHPVGLYFENPQGRSTNPETLQEMIEEVKNMRIKNLETLRSM